MNHPLFRKPIPFSPSKGGRVVLRLALIVVPLLSLSLLLPSCNLIGTALGLGLAKLQFGCLPEGSMIDTANGPVRIETLRSGDVIQGFNGGSVQITQIHQYREDASKSRYLAISFDHGVTIRVSPRHRIHHVPALELVVGDRCGEHSVTRIESIHGVYRSFDLLTEDEGYRIGGIPVNSMIEEMLMN
jgi:hypothetical protein